MDAHVFPALQIEPLSWSRTCSHAIYTDALYSSLTFWLLLRSCKSTRCLREVKRACVDLTLTLPVCDELFSGSGLTAVTDNPKLQGLMQCNVFLIHSTVLFGSEGSLPNRPSGLQAPLSWFLESLHSPGRWEKRVGITRRFSGKVWEARTLLLTLRCLELSHAASCDSKAELVNTVQVCARKRGEPWHW